MKKRLCVGLVVVAVALACASCSSQNMTPLPPLDPVPEHVTKKPGMTWYHDVLPIAQRSCQGCHTPGGIAPFSLMTYQDSMPYAQPMAGAVQARVMPPWMPSSSCQTFRDARVLTQDEVNTFYSWADDNAPAGSPADTPPPAAPAATLPWVDVTMDPGADYRPPLNQTTDYRCFLLDPKLSEDRDLIGFAVEPGAKGQVHHVLLYPAAAAEASMLDSKEPGVGWTCFGGPGTANPSTVGGWVPGSPPTQFPPNTGIQLAAGKVLIMQIHYNIHTESPLLTDRTVVKLQLAKQPVAKTAQVTLLRNSNFSIPPDSTGYRAEATMTIPQNVILYGLQPHAHTLAKRLTVQTGGNECLIDLPKWDFSWQQMYFYANQTGMPLSKGTKVTLTCVWDNSTASTVHWGESTADEMCLTYFYTTAP